MAVRDRSQSTATPVGTIVAEQLWKRFRADSAEPLLRDHIRRISSRVRGEQGGWRWVLKDLDLRIDPGESVGLIGINGSGKSTLLKVLSGVMVPDAGRLSIEGRIGALIEVRAGIHPELTGRENIFFYGTILGMTRRQVAERFDTIVEFAELSDAVDRQVKFYSSGMGMRLGFSIAAFLDPDILLVDEVLAVGDIDFQQRCLERMREVLRAGTTLVLVTHDMAAVESMCARTVWLDHGVMRAHGPTAEVVQSYRAGLEEKAQMWASELSDPARILGLEAWGEQPGERPVAGGPAAIELEIESEDEEKVELCVGFTQGPGTPIFLATNQTVLPSGRSRQRCRITSLPLPSGRYYVWAGAFSDNRKRVPIGWHPVGPVDVGGAPPVRPNGVLMLSPVHVDATWESE